MNWLRRIISRTRARTDQHKSFERAMSAELEFHIEQATEDYIAQGLSPAEARTRARREFGSLDLAKEELRDTQRLRWLTDFVRDLRYALRGFRRAPGFAITAIVVLALGIGANTAVFTLFDRVLLASLPVENPEQLVELSCLQNGEPNRIGCASSYPGYLMFRERSGLFQDIAAYGEIAKVNMLADGVAGIAKGMVATGNFFELLGVRPEVGRLFGPADDSASVAPVAVLSYGYFQRRFGADPNILGSTVEVKGVPVTVIGVTPPEFRGPSFDLVPDIVFPVVAMTDRLERPGYLALRDSAWFRIVMRKFPKTSLQELQSALAPTYAQVIEDTIETLGTRTAETATASLRRSRLDLQPARSGMASDLRRDLNRPLQILMVAVVIVLLIACANLAGLMLVRGACRQQEFTVRSAIGASRSRIVRQVLAESLLIALLGAGAGLVLATWIGPLLLQSAAGEQGLLAVDPTPNLTVFGFAIGATLASALLIGWFPAWRISRAQAQTGLHKVRGERSAIHSLRLMIPLQVGFACVLLIGAVLFVNTFENYRRIDLGYRPTQLLTIRLFPEGAGYDSNQFRTYLDHLLPQLRSLPGVTALTTSVMPVGRLNNRSIAQVPGFPAHNFQDQLVTRNWVGTDYMKTAGLRLIAGRDLSIADQDDVRAGALVNEAFARRFFPDGALSPKLLDRPFRIGNDAYTVAGVVADARDSGPKSAPEPTVYVPIRSVDIPRTITLRIQGTLTPLIPMVRDTLRQVAPSMPVMQVEQESVYVDQQLHRERLLAYLTAVFSALALLLVGIGLYGTLAGAVSARTPELGVRMALGAVPRNTVWLLVRESVLLVAAGVAGGLLAGAFLSRLIEAQLFGVEPSDPGTYVVSALVLLGAAAVAAFVPARRAARMDPASVLRSE